MVARYTAESVAEVLAYLTRSPFSVTAQMTGIGVNRSQEGARRILSDLNKSGKVDLHRGSQSGRGAVFLWTLAGREMVVPPGVRFVPCSGLPSKRRRGGDCGVPHQVVGVKAWDDAPRRHPLDIAFFGPAGVRGAA